ncbi:ParM/StbA family protein [Ureibacillus chungkukjangi]|uniref:ParM/StbA family protein n=1 Tax=Ureibacillus chungkukjangi TaxID=1202712 RepID=UPI00204041D9|nr:ParM/StbA family protein [Ureibacillus chungkukjangi]MCM3390226.1 ParM/StbA family protein [Ureibacillus chungkukjangi]
MKEEILIACDVGRHTSKALMNYNGKTFISMFRTKIQEINNLGMELEPGSFHVKYENIEYLIGDVVSEDYNIFDLDKTSLPQKIAVYTCIADLLQKANLTPQNVTVRLAVNIPINMYKDAKLKQKYKSFIENNGAKIFLSLNQKPFILTLSDITIAFEGMGVVFEQMENTKSISQTICIDIGGLNTTLCTFYGIQPNFDSMSVSNLGINVLKGKMGKAINERYGIAVSANDLEQILQNGYLSHRGKINEDSKAVIEKIKSDFFLTIIQFALSRSYTFNNAEIHFCGGGSLMLQEYIKEEFPNAKIVINPQFANVRSFLKILEVKYK